jgi:hypothetical protein
MFGVWGFAFLRPVSTRTFCTRLSHRKSRGRSRPRICFKYLEICGQRIFEVAGDPTGRIYDIRDAPDGLLLRADNGLFRYDGKRTRHVAGDSVWRIGEFLRRPGMRRLFLHTSRADATDRS